MAKLGRPPIGPPIKARVTPDLAAILRERAATRDQTLSDAVREALARGVQAIREDEQRTAG